MDGDTIGIVAHGHATIIGRNDDGVEELEPVWREIYGSSPFDWAEGVVFMRVEPTSMWAYAFHPENFPESPTGSRHRRCGRGLALPPRALGSRVAR
jgi:hypothetical protein